MHILFLGAPGAGKGTQCQRLSKHLDIVHLSSGDLLRHAVKIKTPAGTAAASYMAKGVLVPDPVLIDMFREKLHTPECAKGFILDGFPRNTAQAKSLDELLAELNCELDCVINLQVSEGLLVERLVGRRICSNPECNTPYHIKFAPPTVHDICNSCGRALIQRNDDRAEVVKERLATYVTQTAPLIEYYDQKLLLRTVDGEGDPDEIFADILRTLKVLA